MTPDWRSELGAILGPLARFDEPMSRHTTWKVGGPADCFARIQSETQLAAVIGRLGQDGVPWLIIGRGSNLLVSDAGIEGAVIRLEGDFSAIDIEPDGRVTAGAGVALSMLLRRAAQHHLTGLEFAAGIPGSVGGAVITNAGARGWEFKDVVGQVRMMGPRGGVHVFDRAMLNFTYRRLRLGAPKVVLSARLILKPGRRRDIEADMARHLTRRRQSQPLSRPTAGSVFLNPPGDFAGRLIEQCGLKGLREGGAEVSTVHANFIINLGNGTAADIVNLMRRVQDEVRSRRGVNLVPEVHLVGRGLEGGFDALS